MPFSTQADALQDMIDQTAASLGAVDFRILFSPEPTQNDPYLVVFEDVDDPGTTPWHLVQI